MKLIRNLYDIIGKETDGEVTTYTITLLPSCMIYAAHFPGMPITPGVCQIKMVKELLEDCLGQSLRIVGVKNVKFVSVLTPRESPLKVSISKIKQEDSQVKVQAVIADESTTYAKLSLQTVIA